MSELNLTFDKALSYAQINNLSVNESDEHTLQFDLDGDDAVKIFEERLELFVLMEEIESKTYTTSKSGNKHCYVKTKKAFTAQERVAIQAALGSDWKRELFSTFRILNGNEHASLLFEPNYRLDNLTQNVVL